MTPFRRGIGVARHAVRWCAIGLLLAAVAKPVEVDAQLTEPCRLRCAAVLGVSAYAVATGSMIAAGRASGGISSGRKGARIWGVGFVATVGAGLALGSDGARQERAVYASGLGGVAGTAVGWVVGTARGGEDESRPWAYALVGAGVGALVGGLVGAVTYERSRPGVVASSPRFVVGWTF